MLFEMDFDLLPLEQDRLPALVKRENPLGLPVLDRADCLFESARDLILCDEALRLRSRR